MPGECFEGIGHLIHADKEQRKPAREPKPEGYPIRPRGHNEDLRYLPARGERTSGIAGAEGWQLRRESC
jgi:hypothetical protein